MRLGLYLNELNGYKCKNAIGARQAKQLIKPGSSISYAKAEKMFFYLTRASAYYNRSNRNSCGTISYLLWGGKKAYYFTKAIVNEKRNAK